MQILFALLALLFSTPAEPTRDREIVIKDGEGPVHFLRFSPGGEELVRVCPFGPAMLFDTRNHKNARTFPIGLRMVAYSVDGKLIATAEGIDGARIWDASHTGTPVPDNRSSADRPVPRELALKVRVLETPLRVLQPPSTDSSVRVFWTEFSPDGKHLLTTHANGHVKLWSTNSWTVEADVVLTDQEVRAAAFTPDSRSLLIGDVAGVLHQWSLAQKTEVKTLRTSFGAVTGVTFRPDGNSLVTTHQSKSGRTVMIWDVATWTPLTKQGSASAAFSTDGRILALGGNNVELVDARSHQHIRTIALHPMTWRDAQPVMAATGLLGDNPDRVIPVFVVALAFAPDGRTLAAGCADGSVRLVQMSP